MKNTRVVGDAGVTRQRQHKMLALDSVGVDWLIDEVGELTEGVTRCKPSTFNEEHRYLPKSVTPMPGYLRYAVNPFMREIVDCFDIDSPVREVILKKGVQITWTTVLESVALYYMAHVKTLPGMYVTADNELAHERIENYFLPMLQQSGFADIIRSSDVGNTQKTGSTKNHLQFDGGGFLIPAGAVNPNKARQFSIMWQLQDELDGWPRKTKKGGSIVKEFNDRFSGYWDMRKIGGGSTPKILPSLIDAQFKRGDQRDYLVLCKKCNYPQKLRWSHEDKKTGIKGGFFWETEKGMLIPESVEYRCQKCAEPHFEYDKDKLFSEDEGAHWCPTATPVAPGIRSYHLPALYSPAGLAPWHVSSRRDTKRIRGEAFGVAGIIFDLRSRCT